MRTVFAVIAIALVGLTPAQSDRPQEFQIENTTIAVTSALSFTTDKRDTVYQLRMRFQSAGGGAELIGMGPLPGEGTLTLLVDKPKLTFRTSEKSTLTEVPVTVTGVAAGAGGVELAALADFPVGNTFDCNCPDEKALFERVLETLNTYFFEGVQPQTLTPPQRVVTMFHPLDGVSKPVLGKVAAMLEFPVTLPDKKVGFRLSWVAHESRIQSRATWIPAADKAVISEAEAYVKRVIGRLRGTP